MPAWDFSRSHVRVMLRDIETEAHVGLHPWERHPERPTRLIVNVDMFAPMTGKHGDAAAGAIIDYDRVRDALKAWPNLPYTPLLETLVERLVDLSFADPRVQACRVSVVKPDVFNEVAAVGVEVFRVRDE